MKAVIPAAGFGTRFLPATKAQAKEMIVMGFIEPFSKELPMEYAVELNQLIKLEMTDSIG